MCEVGFGLSARLFRHEYVSKDQYGNTKSKLEVAWNGKENRLKLEPRILIEDPEKSYRAPYRVADSANLDNRLIFGDNLTTFKVV